MECQWVWSGPHVSQVDCQVPIQATDTSSKPALLQEQLDLLRRYFTLCQKLPYSLGPPMQQVCVCVWGSYDCCYATHYIVSLIWTWHSTNNIRIQAEPEYPPTHVSYVAAGHRRRVCSTETERQWWKEKHEWGASSPASVCGQTGCH